MEWSEVEKRGKRVGTMREVRKGKRERSELQSKEEYSVFVSVCSGALSGCRRLSQLVTLTRLFLLSSTLQSCGH
jgi:hypothetical protein